VVASGDYALVVNPHVGYVSLLRRTEPAPEAEEVETLAPPVQPAKRDGSWFEPAAITTVKQTRGLTR